MGILVRSFGEVIKSLIGCVVYRTKADRSCRESNGFAAQVIPGRLLKYSTALMSKNFWNLSSSAQLGAQVFSGEGTLRDGYLHLEVTRRGPAFRSADAGKLDPR